jgi:hypothetical protein
MTYPGEVAARRLAAALRAAIESADVSMREVDRRIGWAPNYTSQLLRGTVDLKLWQLLGILEVIGRKPEEFFAAFYQLARGGDRIDEDRVVREFMDTLAPSIREMVDRQVDHRLNEGRRPKKS